MQFLISKPHVTESVSPILKKFRPEWDISKVQKKAFSEGHINAMAGFYVAEMGSDSVVIRVNGPSFGLFDRVREMKYQQLCQGKTKFL